MASPQSPFLKQLASSDRRARDKAVQTLRSYLSHNPTTPSLELLKLWKGLFYTMWMSDKPRTQQALARDLAGLLEVLDGKSFIEFAGAFWETMRREWLGIDVLRMDKFLFLVRLFVREAWEWFARRGWDKQEGVLREYLSVLEKVPLSPGDRKVPDGMRYHVLDIWVDEMDRVDRKREGKMPVDVLLEPVRKLEAESVSKKVRERAREALEDERLRNWNGEGGAREEGVDRDDGEDESQDGGDEKEWEGIDD